MIPEEPPIIQRVPENIIQREADQLIDIINLDSDQVAQSQPVAAPVLPEQNNVGRDLFNDVFGDIMPAMPDQQPVLNNAAANPQ